MGRLLLKVIYYLVGIPVGLGCFYAFVVFMFSLDDGFLSERDPMRAMLSAAGGIGGITAYLLLGRPLFGSYKHIPSTLMTVFIAALLTLSIIAGLWS
ncbi:hypothetical protein [Cohnella sp. GCM10027633]|uniref:hypothetical protein n=1 Tax=unclassified Cohnella TaxID=2636738 RepID=UPI003642C458